MIPLERQQKTLTLLNEHGGILSINELVKLLGVSHMTVRRDLQVLEQKKLISPVFGGVRLAEKQVSEPSRSAKEVMAAAEKSRIGLAAASLVSDGSCVYLDAGTTTHALAHHLIGKRDLTVVSNDFAIMQYLEEHSVFTLIHTGGQVLRENRSAVGLLAAQIFTQLSIDVAFLSASSWDLNAITTPDLSKVAVKQAAVKASRRRVLVSDASKYATAAAFVAVPIEQLHCIITDKKLPQHAVEVLQGRTDLELVLV